MKKITFSFVLLFSIHAYSQTWNLSGNGGTTAGTNFLGTTDNQPIVFKVNNVEKLRLTTNGRLVFYNSNGVTFSNNLYIAGGNEIPSNNAGGVNWGNVSIGLGSMTENSIGNGNVALGFNSLSANTIGNFNTALGINSMQNSISTFGNVGIGPNTLSGAAAGEHNTAVGFSSLRAWGSTASVPIVGNTALGAFALLRLTNGNYNTVLGFNGFLNTLNASNNISVGYNNAPNANNATGNIYIGNNISPFNSQPSNELNIGNWIVGNNGTIGIGQFTNQLPADGIAPDGERYKLFVKDGIKTEKVKVDIAANNGWADYVFQKDYKLMPLNELDQFINKNGHLPEVPTTEEAIKNGIELKEMNILLLKKVEELTLHVIEQQKRIETLEKKIK